MTRNKMLTKEWYESWYSGREKIFGWNIGRPHSGLIEILDKRLVKAGRVLVPGCGIGYDAILLAERGFNVVAFDFSVNAIKKARFRARSAGKLKGNLRFEVEDIYDLPDSFLSTFDYVVEIGNFQAMSVKELLQISTSTSIGKSLRGKNVVQQRNIQKFIIFYLQYLPE